MADIEVDTGVQDVVLLDEAGAPASVTAAPEPGVVVVDDDAGAEPLPKTATLQPDGSVILTLGYPVTMRWKSSQTDQVREESRTSFHFHRLTGADMRALMSAGEGHFVPTGLARSCRMRQGLFNAVFDRMDAADAAAAGQVLNFFLSAGAPTRSGPPSSR